MADPVVPPQDSELVDRYVEGDAAGMLEIEYSRFVEVARRFSEREARRQAAPGAPAALEIVSHVAREVLPYGPAPSLSDALDALDRLYASWQAEPAAYQRVQARHLAYHQGQLQMLALVLASDPPAGEKPHS
jgi:hypothetical protein